MKTNPLRLRLSHLSGLLLLVLPLFFPSKSWGQHPVPGQDSAFALYSQIDTVQWKKYSAAFDFETFDLKRIHQLRQTLQTYLPKQDPLAEFLYAASMDLYPYGHGKPNEAAVALKYYTKAADKGLVLAEKLLFDMYRYGLMEQPRNEKKALAYLLRVIQHGDGDYKAKSYSDLATLFESGEFTTIKPNKDSVLYYLERALVFTPNDTWVLDYAGGTYEEKGNYPKAITYLLRSDNEQSHIKVARWLIEGTQVQKDVNRALQILYKAADKVIKAYGEEQEGYMGGSNPVHVLNDWYHCKKWITRQQVGKYYDENWICD